MEDEKLLALLRKDPEAGMERLMDQYAGLVYAVVRGRLPASLCVSTDAEDCVADVFSAFYTRLSDYDPSLSGIRTYLCVLARNIAADCVRKRGKQGEAIPLDDEACLLQLADSAPVEECAAEEELRKEVFAAIRALGKPDADILLRKFYLSQSSKEIADALGLTVSNVDTRTHRALNKLRGLFGGSRS